MNIFPILKNVVNKFIVYRCYCLLNDLLFFVLFNSYVNKNSVLISLARLLFVRILQAIFIKSFVFVRKVRLLGYEAFP